MDSPERNLTITAAEVQGSPLFNFLCGLSPIKPVKSVHVAPTFSELSFPPPPAVFVSPKVDARNSREQSKSRVEVVQARSGSCRVKLQTENRQLFRNQAQKDQNLGYTEKNKDIALPCSELVEEYLAEPVEQELQTVSSSEFSTVSNTCHGEARTLEPDFEDVERLDEALTPPVMPPKFPENDGMKMRSAAGFDKERVDDAAGVLGQGTSPSKKSSSIAVHPNSEGNEKDEEIMELDRESSDFVFLLSQGSDRLPPPADIDDLQNHSSSALSALSIISTVGESIKDQGHKSGEAEMPTHVSTNSLGNKGPDVSGTCKKEAELVVEPEAGGRQQALVCRVNVQSQRVVRRRCLDFEVPEDQWKNKSSISLLKSRAVKSNTSSQSALSCDTNSKIPVLVLKERAAATSGATNSQSTQDTDTCTHVYPRTDASASSVANVKSTLLRLSRCSSLNDKECTQAKPDSQLALVACPSGTSPVPVGMPSGIGLHLNSLTGSMSFSHSSRENHEASGSTALSKSSSALIGLAPLASMQESPSEDYGNCLIAASSGNNLQVGSASAFRQGLVVSLFEKTRTDECQVQSEHSDRVFSSKRSMTCYRSVTLGIKRMEESLPSSLLEKKPSPLGRKRVLLQDFPQQLDSNGLEDSNQSPHSPKKKRRQSTSTTEKSGDGCKRCNCKKSKCLKLYCDCFAAGIYCVDSCSCQDCFNKPEFEDKVLETRQQIESRNPLAFAPKIVQAVDSSPTDGEECGDTPASARHKRGCNCKKSQCLKKYCECYQVGVGCSDGCRCENCRNVYGRKEGPDELEEKDCLVTLVDKDVGEELFDTSDNRFNSASQQQNNDLSPITPSFQYAGQDRSTVKSRSSSKRHIPSEELHSPTFLLSSAKPPKSPSRLLRSNRGSSTSASMGMQLSKIAGSPNTTPNLSRTGQFSPRWDGLGDICTLTPLPQAPLRPTPASASVLDGPASSPSTNGKPCNELSSSGDGSVRTSSKFLRGASPISQYPVSRSLLGGRPSQSPMNVQRTPMTPIFTSGSKIVHEDLDVLGHQFVGSTEDDNTPEFLKDTDFTGSPVQVFKTTSPKQKRVSPPHHQGPRETPNQPRQSPGMRSRKFVLQSIPLIPPTPVAVVHEQVNGSRSEA